MQVQVKKNSYIWNVFGISIFLYLAIMFFIFNISVSTIFRFVLLNIISIFLPGFAILSFIGLRLPHIGQICTSYILGYAFTVLEYYLAEIFNREIPFIAVTMAFAVGSCGIIIWQFKRGKIILEVCNSDSEIIEISFWALFLILNTLAYAANYLGTDVISVFSAHRDMQYWANNTVALRLSWPADTLFMSGYALNYHYFSNIPIAFLCEAFQIDVFTMSFPLYTMTKAIIMVGATGFLLDSIKPNKKVTAIGYTLILCTTGMELVPTVTYVHHTLLSPFGFDIGYAYGMMFIAFLIRQWNKDKMNVKLLIGTMLVWIMCVGAKAPIASVLILLAAFSCLYWLIHKQWDLSFGYGGSILIVFLLICNYCVGMSSVMKGESAWSLGLYEIDNMIALGNPEDWAVVAKILVAVGRLNPVVAVIVQCICINPTVISGTISSVIINVIWIKQKKLQGKNIFFRVALGLTALWGLALGIVINAGGSSEMYFSMAALLPMFCMIFITATNWVSNGSIKVKKQMAIYRTLEAFFVVLLVVGVYRFSCSAFPPGMGVIKYSLSGLKNIYYSMTGYDYSDQIASGIRNTDVEALNWIRDNAEKDALIMTDKAVMADNSAYYLYGIFCERQQYLEGSNMLAGEEVEKEIARRKEIIHSVYNNIDGAIQFAKNEGIDYIVQTVDITPGFIYDEEQLELVENTETMNIYKVK